MRVFKPLKLGLSTRVQPYGGAGLFVVTTFTLFDLLDPTDILAETALWPLAGQELPKGAILDEGMPKPHGEVLVAGKAMAPNGRAVPEMAVGFEVGEVHRVFNIFGNREWVGDPSEPTITAPQPFTEIPLIAERAFGGEGYAQNPVGIGFHDESLLATGFTAPLPNVELWGKEVLEPTDHPRPALIGSIGPGAPERIALAGTYDQAWIDHRMPEFPDDFDPRYHHAAQHDQRVQGFFAGDEPIYLIGMSADHPEVTSRLPGVRARAFVNRASDPEGLREVKMHADTVWIFGSQLKGVVINRGAIAIADRDGLDVDDVMVGYEWASEPERSWDHYAEVFRLRSDPEEGYKYALADRQLAPVIPEEVLREREQRRFDEAAARAAKVQENMEWAQKKQIEKAGLPAELAPKIAQPETKPLLLPLPEELESGDIDIARLLSDVEEIQREAEVKAALIARKTDELNDKLPAPLQNLPASGMTDEELALARAELGPGPGFLPPIEDMLASGGLDDIFSNLSDRAALAEPMGELLDSEEQAGLDQILSDFGERPARDEEEAFSKACARVLRLPEGSPLAEVRKQLEGVNVDDLTPSTWLETDGLDSGEENSTSEEDLDSFLADLVDNLPNADPHANDDLMASVSAALPALKTGTDESPVQALQRSLASATVEDKLSPIDRLDRTRSDLEEADEAFRQSTDEARLMAPVAIYPLEPLDKAVAIRLGAFIVDLLKDGRDLSRADLAGADLEGVDFSGRDLSGTCFEACNLVGAQFAGANCSRAVFTNANLTGADFSKANLEQANLSSTISRHACFKRARLVEAQIIKSDFIDVDFTGADLTRATLIESDISRCRLDRATLGESTFAQIKSDHVSAKGASLSSIVVATASFDDSSWKGATFEKVAFADVSFERADFSKATLVDSAFSGNVGFVESRFDEAQVINSGFHGADLSGASFHLASVKSSNFMQATLSDCDLRLAAFTKSNLNYAILHRVNAFGGHFAGSGFRAADLHYASFRGANLYGADLSETCLAAVDFTGANVRLTNMEASVE